MSEPLQNSPKTQTQMRSPKPASAFVFSNEGRKRAQQDFVQLALPSKHEEPWRKIQLHGLPLSLVSNEFSDNQAGPTLRIPEGAQAEVFLWDGRGEAPELFSDLENTFAQTKRPFDYFDLLNRAFAGHYLVIRISGDLAEPIQVLHEPGSRGLYAPRIYLLLEENVHATIIESYPETGEDEAADARLLVPASLALLKQASRLEHIVEAYLPRDSWHFLRARYQLGRDASLLSGLLHTGGKNGKDVIWADLPESGADFRGIGIRLGLGPEFSDLDAGVSHLSSHSQSSLLYKTVLSDKAHSVFTGNLHIEPGTKDINSHQENHNILLSDTARAESMPDLVIKAEEVSCEHGATVGALDEDALFFLMARGLPEEAARELLIEAFLSSLLSELTFGIKESEARANAYEKRISYLKKVLYSSRR